MKHRKADRLLGPAIEATDSACPYCDKPHGSPLPVTQEDFEQFKCPVPNCLCTTVGLTAVCHPEAGQIAYYCKKHGTLSLFCGDCGGITMAFKISSGPVVQ